MATKIKDLMEILKNAEAKLDVLDQQYEADPENKQIEKQWDEQYGIVFRLHNELEDEIVKFSNGLIGKRLAHTMVGMKRSELQDLVDRLSV